MSARTLATTRVFELPTDYRFANACESERIYDLRDAIQVVVGGDFPNDPMTDLAVPVANPVLHYYADCECD